MVVFTSAAALGATILGAAAGTITFATVAVGFLAQTAIGLALNALAPKPKFGSGPRGYNVTQRGSALDHQIIYGEARVGGAILYDGTTGENNKFLHRVIGFAGHEVESFSAIYINDEEVTLDTNGNVTSPSRYDGLVRINTHLGASDQLADPDLVDEIPEWTAQHRLRGIAYMYVRLKFDQDAFPNGVPEITAKIKGKKAGEFRWAAHNMMTYTDRLANPIWTTVNTSVTGNAINNPDGELKAELLTEDSTTDRHFIYYDSIIQTTENEYTIAIWAKTNGRDLQIRPRGRGTGEAFANFNLTTGEVGNTGGASFVSATIEAYADSWYLCKLVLTSVVDPTVGAEFCLIETPASDGEAPSHVGDGTSGVYLWGSHFYRSDRNGMVNASGRNDTYVEKIDEADTNDSIARVVDPSMWSDNPALCIRDYISSGYGLSESAENIDDAIVEVAADVCDRIADNGEKFFTCNGNFTTAQSPYDILNDLLTSMGGLLWYSQGKWRMKPAYWVAPTLTLTEDDLRSSVAVKTRHSRRDNFNVVRGTFRGDETDWQITDYPEVSNPAFLTADNGQESVVDIELPFTDNSDEARRIARIALERNRQQLTVAASFGLQAFECQVGDVINLTISRFGWASKPFEVTSWTFGLVDDNDLQVQMTLREISESVFDEVDDGVIYERDNTTLLSPFEVPGIGINATATTQVLREKLTNVIAVRVSSGRPEAIDRVEVDFKDSSESADQYASVGTGELGLFRIVDVDAGDYDIRARAINSFGVKGEWQYLSNVSANGLLEPPSDVSGLSAEVNGATIHLEWEPVPDLDLSYYRIRHSIEETGATWANATTAVDKVPRPATAVSLPTRPGTYHIKAVDKSGVASQSYTSIIVPEANLVDFANSDTQTEEPTFSGSKTGCSVTSGTLEITDPSSAPSTATYDFGSYIDTGAARRVRSRVEVNVVRKNETSGNWDDLPGLFDDLPGLFDDFTGDADFADCNVQAYISITQDDPAGTPTWTDYQLFRAGEYYGRAFRFRVILSSTSDDITPSITGLKALVEYN
jgi:hypothetical protein